MANASNILIYTMGRVGSVAVRKSLEKSGVLGLHVHNLFSSPGAGEPGYGGARWREVERWRRNDIPLKYITILRDPIERAISSWIRTKSSKHIVEQFPTIPHIGKSILQEQRIEYTLSWFSREVDVLLKTDSLAMLRGTNFKTKGHYLHYFNNEDQILFIKTECLDRKEDILSNFVKRNVRMTHDNVSVNRPDIADYYRKIHEELKFERSIVEKIYSHKLSEAAFTREQLRKKIEAWS